MPFNLSFIIGMKKYEELANLFNKAEEVQLVFDKIIQIILELLQKYKAFMFFFLKRKKKF